MNYIFHLGNTTYNNNIIIYQKYDGMPISTDFTFSGISLQLIRLHLFIILISLLIYCIIMGCFNFCWINHRIHKMSSISMTATEMIYKMFNYNEHLIRLTFVEFIGLENAPKLDQVTQLKRKYEQTNKDYTRKILCLYHIIMLILITSLLFAGYCGVIFLVQSDGYRNRFDIPFKCYYYSEDNLCQVFDDSLVTFYDEYDHFYEEIFYPYIVEHYPNINVTQLENNGVSLFVRPRDIDTIKQVQNGINTDNDVINIDGYLYLSENKLEDSDVKFDDDDTCWCCCCSCCEFWVGLIVLVLIGAAAGAILAWPCMGVEIFVFEELMKEL
eukprot:200864_1